MDRRLGAGCPLSHHGECVFFIVQITFPTYQDSMLTLTQHLDIEDLVVLGGYLQPARSILSRVLSVLNASATETEMNTLGESIACLSLI